jgi:hypothetical protein
MEIVRNPDGSLIVPVPAARNHGTEDISVSSLDGNEPVTSDGPTTRVLHPGEGGFNEALAEWDSQQNPDRPPVVSTATGREEAMSVVHNLALSPDDGVGPAVDALEDPEASGEALRHVLLGGVHSVEAFAVEVTEAEGGAPVPIHQLTKIIGEVLAELDE